MRLIGVLGGEVGGISPSRHISVARPIHGDATADIRTAPPQVGGVEQGVPGGVEFGDKNIPVTTAIRPLIGVLGGEVGGRSPSRHVSIAGPVYGDAVASVITAPSQVGGVDQGGVNSQGVARVVVAPHRKAAGAHPVQHKGRLYLHPPPANLLVSVGLRVLQLAPPGQDEQVALSVQAQPGRAPVGQPDVRNVRPGLHHESVLERPCLTAVAQVDAGVELVVDHFPVGGDIRVPLRRVVPDEVVNFGRPLLHAHRWGGFGPHEA